MPETVTSPYLSVRPTRCSPRADTGVCRSPYKQVVEMCRLTANTPKGFGDVRSIILGPWFSRERGVGLSCPSVVVILAPRG